MYQLKVTTKQLQTELTNMHYYVGAIDGIEGRRTLDGYAQALAHEGIRFDIWQPDRVRIAFAQLCFKRYSLYKGIIDGLMGPNTDYAQEQYIALWQGRKLATWRDNAPTAAAIQAQPATLPLWPKQDEESMNAFFGVPGTNIVSMELPYPMRLAWDRNQVLHSIQINAKVKDSAHRVLTKVASLYTPAQLSDIGLDLFGGCLNIRKMRGGSKMSVHSWGCAIDFDPERNQLKWGKDQARLAHSDAYPFWDAWAEEGWVSLGNTRNYDWMHVQAARF